MVAEELRLGRDEGGVISDRTATILIIVVTAIWVTNIVAGMLRINDYRPSESINGIFLTIVGGAFALRARAKPDDQKED